MRNTIFIAAVAASIVCSRAGAQSPAEPSHAPQSGTPGLRTAKHQTGPAEGITLYVLVKKLNRLAANSAQPFSVSQAQRISDLLEPLFEQPTLSTGEARSLVKSVTSILTPEQRAAVARMTDINAESAMPRPSMGMPPGFGPPPGGPPPGDAPSGGTSANAPAPGGPPPGGPPPAAPMPGGPPGGGPPGMGPGTAALAVNPFYASPGNPIAEQATRDLRKLLNSLEQIAPVAKVTPVPIALAPAQKINVTTFHYNPERTGWNPQERVLTPHTVSDKKFGRLWHTPLDGEVYAAPLVVRGEELGGTGHDAIYAPTENNSVYALDASTGAVLWRQHLADALTDPEYDDCINITPIHGITSTPVIDLPHHAIYVCGLTRNRLKQNYKVWALDLVSGAVKPGWPVTLKGEYKGTPFDSGQVTQRGALNLVNGWLFMPFSSRCDIGEWHGWVAAVNTEDATHPQRVFSPTPDTSGGGIWGSAGLTADSAGNLYVVTGNGDYNLKEGGRSIDEAIVRLSNAEDLAFSYQTRDFFVPTNHDALDRADADLGGSSAIVVDQRGSKTPHLLVTGGKDGVVYVVDRDNLGGVGGALQEQRIFGQGEGGFGSFIKTTPAWYSPGGRNSYLFVTGNDAGQGGTQGVVALRLGVDEKGRSHFAPVWSAGRPLYQPGAAVVSSRGGSNAIVWVIESNKNDDDIGPAGVLHAYDARTGKELYRSNRRERRDSLGDARKFSAPTVANGRVYCGTDGIVAYGPIEERSNGM